MKHGNGTFYSEDGSYFTGNFYQNKKNGLGIMTYFDGTVYEETW